jgi:hypothetical protein
MSVQPGPIEKRYAANGVTTIYAVPFLVIEAGDLKVYLNGVLQTSGYTQTGVGQPTSSITFTIPPTGDLYLVLEIPFQRLVDYQENGDFLASTVNRDFDRIWQALKQLLTTTSRSPVLGVNDVDGEGWYLAKGNGIRNLRDPVEAQDAATRGWAEQFISDILATGQGPVNNAANVIYSYPNGTIHTVQSLSGSDGAKGIGESRYGGTLSGVLGALPYYASLLGLGSGADDKPVLQALINSLSLAGGGHIVMDCNTDYVTSDTIYVKSNVDITFTGTGFLKLTASSTNGAVLVVYSQNVNVLTENVTIVNPRIDGGNFGYPTGAAYGENGVAGTNCKHVRVYGGLVKNCRRGASSPVGTGGKAIQFEGGVDDILVDGLTAENCTILCETGGSPNDTSVTPNLFHTGTRVIYRNLRGKNIERPISLMQLFNPPGDESVVNCLIDGVQLYNCGREGVAGTETNFGIIVGDRYTGAIVRNVQCYNDASYGKVHSVVRMRRGRRNEIKDISFIGDCDYLVSHREPTGGGTVSDLKDNVFGPIRHYGTCNTYAVGGVSGDTAFLLDNIYDIYTDVVTSGLIDPQIQVSTLFGAFTSGSKVQRVEGPFNLIGGYFANTYYSGAFGYAGSVNISGLSVAAVSGGYALDCPGDMFLRRSGSDRLRTTSVGVRLVAPTYADNATALAGGLVAADVYKTAAGDLRIVV